jgi:hypothetical protein
MARPRPVGIALGPLLTIRGLDAAHFWLNKVLGVPIRRYTFVRAVRANEVECKRMGGSLYFSTQSLYYWASSLTEKVS